MNSLSLPEERSVVSVSDYMSARGEQRDLYNWCDTTRKNLIQVAQDVYNFLIPHVLVPQT